MQKTHLILALVLAAIGVVSVLSVVGKSAESPEVTSQPTVAPFRLPTESELQRQALTQVPCPTPDLDPGILATPLREVDFDSFDTGIQAPTPVNPQRFTLRSNADNRCFFSEFRP